MKNNYKIWQCSKPNGRNKENEGKTVLGRRKPKKQEKFQNLSQKKPKTFLNPFDANPVFCSGNRPEGCAAPPKNKKRKFRLIYNSLALQSGVGFRDRNVWRVGDRHIGWWRGTETYIQCPKAIWKYMDIYESSIALRASWGCVGQPNHHRRCKAGTKGIFISKWFVSGVLFLSGVARRGRCWSCPRREASRCPCYNCTGTRRASSERAACCIPAAKGVKTLPRMKRRPLLHGKPNVSIVRLPTGKTRYDTSPCAIKRHVCWFRL